MAFGIAHRVFAPAVTLRVEFHDDRRTGFQRPLIVRIELFDDDVHARGCPAEVAGLFKGIAPSDVAERMMTSGPAVIAIAFGYWRSAGPETLSQPNSGASHCAARNGSR